MGTIRNWLETLKAIANLSGLTLQVADVFDANAHLRGIQSPPSSTDAPPLASGPKGVQ